MKEIKYLVITLISILLLSGPKQVNAQLIAMQAQYFENQYLVNPAMAGLTDGLNLGIGYQSQWTSIQGSPKLQSFTADYNSGGRVGLGLSVNADQAGLISRTRGLATYAYHLPLNARDKINFGLSVGFSNNYIDYSKIDAQQGDLAVQTYNEQRIYVDGDVGISYQFKAFDVQAVVPNLGTIFFPDQRTNLGVDRSTFYTSASYKFFISGKSVGFDKERGIIIEPKATFRGVKGFKNIMDFGANLTFQDYNFNLFALYHTSQSVTGGLGINIKPLRLLFSYTNNTGPLSAYANNTFELGLKYTVFNK